MLKLALVKADKNNGQLTKPDASKFTSVNSLLSIADDKTPKTAKITGYPGEQIAQGQLYAGNYDTNANKIVGELVPVPAVKLAGDPSPKDVKANSNGSVSED